MASKTDLTWSTSISNCAATSSGSHPSRVPRSVDSDAFSLIVVQMAITVTSGTPARRATTRHFGSLLVPWCQRNQSTLIPLLPLPPHQPHHEPDRRFERQHPGNLPEQSRLHSRPLHALIDEPLPAR